jgi:hypothetical protein
MSILGLKIQNSSSSIVTSRQTAAVRCNALEACSFRISPTHYSCTNGTSRKSPCHGLQACSYCHPPSSLTEVVPRTASLNASIKVSRTHERTCIQSGVRLHCHLTAPLLFVLEPFILLSDV